MSRISTVGTDALTYARLPTRQRIRILTLDRPLTAGMLELMELHMCGRSLSLPIRVLEYVHRPGQ